MSIIIRLQNLPWTANSADIRQYFSSLSIPEGGVHIVGGENGDAFIAFSSDEDARQAMLLDGGKIKDVKIKLLLSSRSEMQKVIEVARQQALNMQSIMQLAAAAAANPLATATAAANLQLPLGSAAAAAAALLPTIPGLSGTTTATTTPEIRPVVTTSATTTVSESASKKTESSKDKSASRARSSSLSSRSGSNSRSRSRSRDRRHYRDKYRYKEKSRDHRERRRRDRSHSKDRDKNADDKDRRSRSRERYRKRSKSRSRDRDSIKDRDSRDPRIRDKKRGGDRHSSKGEDKKTSSTYDSRFKPIPEVALNATGSNSANDLSKFGQNGDHSHDMFKMSFNNQRPGNNSDGTQQANSSKQGESDAKGGRNTEAKSGPTDAVIPPWVTPMSNQWQTLSQQWSTKAANVGDGKRDDNANDSNFSDNKQKPSNNIPPICNGPSFMGMSPYGPTGFMSGAMPTTIPNMSGPIPPPPIPQMFGGFPTQPGMPSGFPPYMTPSEPYYGRFPGPQQNSDAQQLKEKSVENNKSNSSIPISKQSLLNQTNNQFSNSYPMSKMEPPPFMTGSGPTTTLNNYSSLTNDSSVTSGTPIYNRNSPGVNTFSGPQQSQFSPYNRFDGNIDKSSNMEHNRRNFSTDYNQSKPMNAPPYNMMNRNDMPMMNRNDMPNARGSAEPFKRSGAPGGYETVSKEPYNNPDTPILNVLQQKIGRSFGLSSLNNTAASTSYDKFKDSRFNDYGQNYSSYSRSPDNRGFDSRNKGDHRINREYNQRKEWPRHNHSDRPSDRHNERFTDRHSNGPTDRHSERPTDRRNEKSTDRKSRFNDMDDNHSQYTNSHPEKGRSASDSDREVVSDNVKDIQRKRDPREALSNDTYVVLQNLPLNTTISEVKKFFGPPNLSNQNMKFVTDKEGNQTDVMYVKCNSYNHMRQALSLDGKLIRGNSIKVSQSDQKTFNSITDTSNDYSDELTEYLVMHVSATTIEEEDVKSAIKDHGKPRNVVVVQNNDGQSCSIFLRFDCEDFAQSIMNNKEKIHINDIPITYIKSSNMDEFRSALKMKENGGHIDASSDMCEIRTHSIIPPKFCILLRNLPADVTTDKDIMPFFSDLDVKPPQIHIIFNSDKMPTGECYCEFDLERDARSTLPKNGSFFRGNQITVVPVPQSHVMKVLGKPFPPEQGYAATDIPFNQNRSYFGPPRDHSPPMKRPPYTSGSNSFPKRPPSPLSGPEGFGKPGCVVGLSNIPYRADVGDILEFFYGFNVKRDQIIRRYDDNGRPTADARVSLNSPMEVERAMHELQNKNIWNRAIEIYPV